MHPTTDTNNIQKFRDAEHLWFWFVSSARIRGDLRRGGASESRPCEILDIETLVTRLHLSGRITRDQLAVMMQFGQRRRPPTQHIYAENRAAGLWRGAMRTLQLAASAKGWVE
ncbi:MAG: hypothetical protein FWE64_02985 [Alphaproteobacteria bacterium]|nr:hypothetical protein [Alphaproteobacteria bacterium]